MSASTRLLAIAASVLAIAGAAHAESYDGVHAASGARSRADVQAEAVRAAGAPDQNVVRGSRGAERFTSTADAAAVRNQAIAAAHAPDQNVSGGSRYNSRVISTMANRYEPSVATSGAAATAK